MRLATPRNATRPSMDVNPKPSAESAISRKVLGWRAVFSHPAFISVGLAAATIFSFWPVIHADFINYDDPEYVTANSHVQQGLTWKNVAWAFTTDCASNWHPLTWLSHLLDVTLFGQSAAGPHGVNLLLHTANALLLFFLLQQMTGARWRSAFVAALFALHPLHVESVAWVAERKDVLSTFFWLLTLLAYARFVQAQKNFNPKLKFFYALTLAWFALGLMSKPMLVTLPFVLLLLDFWPLGRIKNEKLKIKNFWQLVREKIPFFLLSAAACAATVWAQQKAMLSLTHLPLADRINNALVAYCGYLGKTIWPVDLVLPYLHPGHRPAMQVVLAAILIAGLCLGAIRFHKFFPFGFVGWFFFLGTLVPVIGVVQVGSQSMADRYTYVPLIGIFIILAWGVGEVCVRWWLPKPLVIVPGILLLVGSGFLTRQQADYWHDTQRLFGHATAVTPDNFIAWSNIGGSLFEQGKLDEAMGYYQKAYAINPNYAEAANSIGAVLASKNSDEAIDWFRKALAIQPNHPAALFNMGNALFKQGNSSESVACFQQALQSEPENFEARNNLGNALLKLGKIDDAILQYKLALEYKPDGAVIHKNLGEMLAAKGKLAEAIQQYRQVLALTNDAATHYSLGLTLAVQGKWDEAITHYTETLRLKPSHADAQYNLGYALKVRGRLDESAVHLREALRLKLEFPLAHFNLGCVLADQGQRDEAMLHLRAALRLKPDYADARKKLDSLESLSH
jgi:protein O-mannosyl-transferase